MYFSLKCFLKTIIFLKCMSVSLTKSDYQYIQNTHKSQSEDMIESMSAPKVGWIDPFDMLADSRSRDIPMVQTDVEIHVLQNRCSNYEVYLRRFVNMFLHAVELRDQDVLEDSINLLKLEFLIGGKDVNTLKEFGKGVNDVPKIEAVSNVFNKIFSQKIPQDRNVSSLGKILAWVQKTTITIISSPEWTVLSSVALMLFLTLWFIYKTHSYRLAIFTLCLTIFFGGFGFTWIRMYEEKEAERYANIVMHAAIPRHCSRESQSLAWYEHMYYRMFGVDCQEFYKIRDIRPIVKVSPTDVLGETISSMFVRPASNIGSAYGNFITSIINHLPFWLKPMGLPLAFIIPILFIVILLAFFFNYQLSLSITGFHLVPSWGHIPQSNVRKESQYVEDCPRKEENNLQQLNSVLSDNNAPVFMMNFKGLQKLSSGSLLGKKSEKEKNEQPTELIEENQSLEEENEEMINDFIEFEKFVESIENQKAIVDRKRRSIHTCAEGESSSTSKKSDLQPKPMIKCIDLSSGDRNRTPMTTDKEIDHKYKTS